MICKFIMSYCMYQQDTTQKLFCMGLMSDRKWSHQKQRSDRGHACPNSALMCPSPLRHAPSHESEGPERKGKNLASIAKQTATSLHNWTGQRWGYTAVPHTLPKSIDMQIPQVGPSVLCNIRWTPACAPASNSPTLLFLPHLTQLLPLSGLFFAMQTSNQSMVA